MTEPTFMGVKGALLVSAATGGAVAGLRAKGPWWLRLASGFVGAAVSYFLTPFVTPIAEVVMERGLELSLQIRIDLEGPNILGTVGFLLGATGMEVVETVAALVRAGRRAVPDYIGEQIKPDS